MIQINHLTKKYGDTLAVDDLCLTLETGKVYGFLGPNGAGKSTTMNMITGYIAATSGEVLINGHEINKEPVEAKKCIGYLPELPPLYMDMLVGEYLQFAAELKQIDKPQRQEQIRRVMEMTGITDVEQKLIRSLSKGYRQRVGLAQALLGFPETIILDEPTVGLDPKQIIEIRELIRTLSKDHTVILSSHILSEISEVCDHVFIISKGKLVASDTMEHLEQQMNGAQEVEMLLRGDITAIGDIAELEMVEHMQWEDEKGSNFDGDIEKEYLVSVTARAGEDIREILYRYCVKADIVILEMKSVVKSLEEVFLKLTGAREMKEMEEPQDFEETDDTVADQESEEQDDSEQDDSEQDNSKQDDSEQEEEVQSDESNI